MDLIYTSNENNDIKSSTNISASTVCDSYSWHCQLNTYVKYALTKRRVFFIHTRTAHELTSDTQCYSLSHSVSRYGCCSKSLHSKVVDESAGL